jgi:multicomponent Na+:H+ antiporter subunit A
MTGLAWMQTRVIQSGYLRYYLMAIVLTVVALTVHAGLAKVWHLARPFAGPIPLYQAGIALLIICSAVIAVRSRSRLGAIAALGVVGYGVALIFALFGAPDLAMTQFLIETLFVVLFVLVFYHLPQFTLVSKQSARARDAIIAISFGTIVTILLLVLPAIPLDRTLIDYYEQMSPLAAHGRNIVNVILVDFRALDTMGEITVLAIAAIGVFALLKLRLTSRGEDRP